MLGVFFGLWHTDTFLFWYRFHLSELYLASQFTICFLFSSAIAISSLYLPGHFWSNQADASWGDLCHQFMWFRYDSVIMLYGSALIRGYVPSGRICEPWAFFPSTFSPVLWSVQLSLILACNLAHFTHSFLYQVLVCFLGCFVRLIGILGLLGLNKKLDIRRSRIHPAFCFERHYVAGTGFEPMFCRLWAYRDSPLLYPAL